MDDLRQQLHQRLAKFDQHHVLAHWDELDIEQRRQLAEQLNALRLEELERLFRQGHALADWGEQARRAMSPPAFRLEETAPAIAPQQALARGHEALAAGQVAVVVVAGGQGTRLGFDKPKGMFPIGPVSRASLFQILIEKVLARSRVAGMRIPLYLMTSDATHADTLEYLRANENFGMASEDLAVFCQGTMPAVDAASGRLLMADKHQLALSPDGHGGMLRAMSTGGVLDDLRRRGIRQVFYCQVDNPLVEMADPLFLGYHLLSGSELSTEVVAKRTSRDKVGNVVSIDGRLQIIEYSDLNPLDDAIVEQRAGDGMPVFWAGNTAIHVFEIELLERASQSDVALPFHVARKAVSHVDTSGTRVEPNEPNAVKFERFIFDLLPVARQSIVVEVDERLAFAPVKNASGEPRDSPETVRQQMSEMYSDWLRAAGCEVQADATIEISPLFAQNASELAAQIKPGMRVTGSHYFC